MGTNTAVTDKAGNDLKVGDMVAVPWQAFKHCDLKLGYVQLIYESMLGPMVQIVLKESDRQRCYLPVEVVKVFTKENV